MIIDEVYFLGVKKLKENNMDDVNLKVKLLMANILEVSKEYLLIHGKEEFPEDKIAEYIEKINILAEGYPIQYITNKQEFFGMDFYVDENVLIPQPDTEILVEETIKIIRKENRKLKILDLCTGSGAIAVSLAKENSSVRVFASDISKDALMIAERNSKANNVNLELIESDLFAKIEEINFDIIVSNPPYIETNTIKDLSSEVKAEPMIALDGGKDGLDFYRKIASQAKSRLSTNGYLIVEIGYNQKETVQAIFEKEEYKNIQCIKDLNGNDRVIIANI